LFLVSEIAKLCVSASLTNCGAIEPDELLSMREILPDFRCCAKVVLVCCNADVKVVGSNPTASTLVHNIRAAAWCSWYEAAEMRLFAFLGYNTVQMTEVKTGWFGLVRIECVKPWVTVQNRVLRAHPLWAKASPLGWAGGFWAGRQTPCSAAFPGQVGSPSLK